jgi:hypothetical protein
MHNWFFGGRLRLELMVYTLNHSPLHQPLFCHGIVLRQCLVNNLPGLTLNHCSWAARISGVSHQCLTCWSLLTTLSTRSIYHLLPAVECGVSMRHQVYHLTNNHSGTYRNVYPATCAKFSRYLASSKYISVLPLKSFFISHIVFDFLHKHCNYKL